MKRVLRANRVLALCSAALFGLAASDFPVADAAQRGDLPQIVSLIRQGADVNEAQGDGMTALHWAAANGAADIADVLIRAGAQIEASTRLGSYTPLHLASRGGHADVVRVLLAAGANPNAATTTGSVQPLHFAAASGNVDVITALLDRGADVNATEREWGHTPLMFAAGYDRAPAIKMLLERGADATVIARTIDIVQRSKEDDAAKALRDQRRASARAAGLNHLPAGSQPAPQPAVASEPAPRSAASTGGGTDANRSRPMSDPEQIGLYGGLTALTMAARDGNVAAVTALLDGGADIDQLTGGDHSTPLLMATLNGHFDLSMMLLGRGANPNLASDPGNTPLFATVHVQWVPKSRHPQTADYLRQRTTYLELMEALLKAGADVNARVKHPIWYLERGNAFMKNDWIGATPFFRAASGTDVEAMKLLVRYGADPNIPTLVPPGRGGGGGCGFTQACRGDESGLPPVQPGGPGIYPIHVASGYGYSDGDFANVHRHVEGGWLPAVQYLVEELGADVNARDLYKGSTPLHGAAARGDNEMILYLVSKGADVMAINRAGLTTVDIANGPSRSISPFPETIKLLESMGVKNNHTCISC